MAVLFTAKSLALWVFFSKWLTLFPKRRENEAGAKDELKGIKFPELNRDGLED